MPMTLHGSQRTFAWSTLVGAAVLIAGGLSLVAQSRQAAPATRTPTAPRPTATAGQPIHVLYVGSDEETPHNPTKMFPLLAAPLARRGIQLTYARTPGDAFDSGKLEYYDAVMIYGDRVTLSAAQQKALATFVSGGHGLVALHSVGD